jgi:allene oxide cyclase-like protein
MRKVPLAGAAAALVLGVAGAIAIPAASHAARSSPAKSTTLVFHVVFSPFEFIQANNVRNPNSPQALGDELVFHDQLFSGGQHVGDEAGSCVIVDVSQGLANCTEVIRLPGGTITAQELNAPPPRKQLAITGGTGIYDAVGGEATLVEFNSVHGKLTLHVLSLVARGGGG